MEALANSIVNFYAQARPVLTSVGALQTYSWLVLFSLLLVVGWNVRTLIRSLSAFTKDEFDKKYGGRPPEKKKGWEKREADLKEFKKDRSKLILGRAFALLVLGMFLPGLTLGVIALNEHWFLSGTITLAVADTPTPSRSIQVLDLVGFVIDQALRGALSDLFEVFGIATSNISNNIENLVFSGIVLGYRMICGAVMLTALYTIIPLIRGRRATQRLVAEAKNKAKLAPV